MSGGGCESGRSPARSPRLAHVSPIALAWGQLLVCALVIGIAGTVLTRSADQVAQATQMSRSWIGLVLLSTATSLPELVTGISASGLAAAPDMAVGDALGSCIFNLMLVALLDLLSRDGSIFRRVDQGHILTAALGIVLIGFVGAQILAGRDALDLRLGHVSVYTPVLILFYFLGMRAAYSHDRANGTLAPASERPAPDALRRPLLRYLVAAAFILLAGTWLPFVGLQIADAMGWRTSFVGTLLLAATTSLPELVVLVVALRMGAADLAIANLLGSNLFDMLVLGVDDLVYTKGSLLAAASPAHAGSAFAAVIMSGLVIIGILDRPSFRVFGVLGWISIALAAIYVLSSYAIFLLGA